MDNQLQQFLLHSLRDIKVFSLQEIPDVIQQLLCYHFWTSLVLFCIGICLTIITFFITKHMIKKGIDEFSITMSLIPSAIIIPPFIFLNLDWIKIWLAPKLYLLEYAKDLIK